PLSSPRRRGPITTKVSIIAGPATSLCCGVWVPAFAGTTAQSHCFISSRAAFVGTNGTCHEITTHPLSTAAAACTRLGDRAAGRDRFAAGCSAPERGCGRLGGPLARWRADHQRRVLALSRRR